MRNMLLSELKKKSNKYFKSVRLNSRDSRELVEYTVRRAYDSLPSYAKDILSEDKEKYISNAISVALQRDKGFSPYVSFSSVANVMSGRTVQAVDVFRRFREESPSVYAKYNSYMYRNGYSASQQFYSHSTWSSKGSVVYIVTELPERIKGKRYQYLTIEYDFSKTNDFFADLI